MAERRMFAKTIIDSDSFIDMPMSTQCLYMHLAMRADDDGFISNPKRIQRMIGAGDDDLKLLIAKSFIIPFDSGIVVIKHWKIHNFIRNDRYKPTTYIEEKSQLEEKDNKTYTLKTDGIPLVYQTTYQMEPQYRLGKDSIDKVSIDKGSIGEMQEGVKPQRKTTRFAKPTLEEVQAYCLERNNNVDAQHFIDYYTANGWKVGKNAMKDWKATVRTWERNNYNSKRNYSNSTAQELDSFYNMANSWAEKEE